MGFKVGFALLALVGNTTACELSPDEVSRLAGKALVDAQKIAEQKNCSVRLNGKLGAFGSWVRKPASADSPDWPHNSVVITPDSHRFGLTVHDLDTTERVFVAMLNRCPRGQGQCVLSPAPQKTGKAPSRNYGVAAGSDLAPTWSRPLSSTVDNIN